MSVSRRFGLAVLGIVAFGASAAHLAHRRADAIRHEVDIALDLTYIPDGRALRLGSAGFAEVMADALWIRTVLLFGQRWGVDANDTWAPWFVRMLEAVTDLDPKWENPYTYGGMMLRVMEQPDASDAIFEKAIENLPDNPFFPFALGMNQYLLRNDPVAAGEWLSKAAAYPGAPAWYASAAAGFLARKNQRAAAIRFLEEELSRTGDEEIRKELTRKLDSVLHDEWSDRLGAARKAYQERFGRDIQRVQDLAALGLELPEDPLGGEWILAPDGVIRSTERERVESKKAQDAERALLLRPAP